MAYGDSANWDGSVPPALSTFTLEWQVIWKRRSDYQELAVPCRIQFFGDEKAVDVAERLHLAWNAQNPQGRVAIYDKAMNAYQIKWENGPYAMEFKCYKDTTPPTPPLAFTRVGYGVRVPIFTGPGWSLEVFKS